MQEVSSKSYQKKSYPKIQQPIHIQQTNHKEFHPQKNHFQLSHNPHFGSPPSIELEKLKEVVQLTLENKLLQMFNVLEIKVLNQYHPSFQAIKESEGPYLQPFKNQRCIILTAEFFTKKLTQVVEKHKLKHGSHLMNNMKLLFSKRNENSKRQMLRINSKICAESQQLDHYDKNYSNEGHKTTQKANKALRKKKQASDRQFNHFKQQMDQLLTHHENYLMKKH